MTTATKIFEIIFYDAGERKTDRLGILEHAIGYARRLVKSGYNNVDVRDVYRDEYVDFLEDVARAKSLISDLTRESNIDH